MERLPVIYKTKLTKEQTYFVNASDLSDLLSDSGQYQNIALRFSDDPSSFKSNYDRFVKHEGKLVILSVRYTPRAEEQEERVEQVEGENAKNYLLTVYAILKTIREELIAEFQKTYFAVLKEWIDEPRDDTWRQKPHALQFLIDIETEKIEIAYDIDFDSYSRHSQKQRFRTDIRKH